MNSITCNNCGSTAGYVYRNGEEICRACNAPRSMGTPHANPTKEENYLLSAYQKLRLGEFREAESEFDDIIREFPQNPNGYWGRLMAKYNFKFEEDFDKRIIPTCYAENIESILAASDYKKALQYSEGQTKEYYKQQAMYIEHVRKEWLEKAKKEKPYDIFISYKESDNGERTQDSEAALELYTHLLEQGYHVFYSRETLRGKTGEKYEPYIFNAIATAKVMIVYSSKPDYITSTWIKNEWTRYERRIQAGEKKPNSMLVVCDGFSPSELPSALSSMQCMNAEDKHFYGDLDQKIEEIIYGETRAEMLKKKRRSKAPYVIAALLLLAAIGGCSAWKFLRPISAVSDSKYGTMISADYGSFSWDTSLRVEALPIDGEWKDTIEALHVDTDGSRLYDMSLQKGEEKLQWEGDLTVTIPLPVGITANRAIVYELSGSAPKKVNCSISDGKIVFTTNRLGIYLIAKREHTVAIDAAVAPTCTETGLTEGSHCSDCNEILTVQQTVAALGHTPGEKATCTESQTCTVCEAELNPATGHSHASVVTAPTCTEKGYTTHTCRCGDSYIDNYVNAVGHTPESGPCTKDRYCTVCNALALQATEHTPGAEATCTEAQTCTVCREELKAALGHTEGPAATCTEAQTCTVCNAVLKAALGHTEGAEATCTEGQHCTVCGVKLQPAKGHKRPTNVSCTEASACTVCGEILEAASGHTPGVEATCTEAQICTVCNTVLKAALGHIPGEEATCTEAQICTTCGEELTPAKGHRPSADATCTEDSVCTACGEVLEAALGHRPGAEATCTTAQTCTVCHAELQPAMGHTRPEDAICTEPSSCTVCGETLEAIGEHTPGTPATCVAAQYCTECHAEIAPALGHTNGPAATCTEAQTCTACGEELTPAKGHTLGAAATCMNGQYCIVCRNEVNPPLDHTPGDPATCTTAQTCTVCNAEVTPALGHMPGAAATCLTAQYCAICGEELTPASGHQVEEWTLDSTGPNDIKRGTCTTCGTTIEIELLYSEGSTYSQNADGTYTVTGIGTFEGEKLVIPPEYEGEKVVGIADNAFKDCTALVSAVIPGTVKTIGEHCFEGCSKLESVSFNEGLKTIYGGAFIGCPIKELVIPDSVTSILTREYYNGNGRTFYYGAFEDCARLTSVVIGNGLTQIDREAFQNCISLQTVTIGESVEIIGLYAFAGCSSLNNVDMGTGVQTIKEYAFSGCAALEGIIIGSSVKTIEQYAFINCVELKGIEFPGNVESIGAHCFEGCSKLESVSFNEGLKTIYGGAFIGCPIKELVIPNSVTSISTRHYNNGNGRDFYYGAFEGCTKLVSVVIGNGITSIEREMFFDCSALSSITFTGTMEEWNALTLGIDWCYNVPATKVVCSDGEVALN